jgi:hypothetical protein
MRLDPGLLHTLLLNGSALLAAMLILWSMVPDIRENFKEPRRAAALNPQRPLRQGIGNLLWALNGLLTGNVQLLVLAGVGAALMMILLLQILLARRG